MSAPDWETMSTVDTASKGQFLIEAMIGMFEDSIRGCQNPANHKRLQREYRELVQLPKEPLPGFLLELLEIQTPAKLAARAIENITAIAACYGFENIERCIEDIWEGKAEDLDGAARRLRGALEAVRAFGC